MFKVPIGNLKAWPALQVNPLSRLAKNGFCVRLGKGIAMVELETVPLDF